MPEEATAPIDVPVDDTTYENPDATAQAAGEAIEFPDDNLTEESFKDLIRGDQLPSGDFIFKVTDYKRKAATAKEIGGDFLTLIVVTPPEGAQPPKGGWPTTFLTFKKYLNPDEKQTKSERFDLQARARFLAAMGVDASQGLNVPHALKNSIGKSFIASVVQSGDFTNLKKFRPLAG